MRQVLIDHARGVGREKRGGAVKVQTDDASIISPDRAASGIVLEEALKLEAEDERKARVVELRIFAGLDNKEMLKSLVFRPTP